MFVRGAVPIALILAACSKPAAHRTASLPARGGHGAVPVGGGPDPWTYDVTAMQGARELSIVARFPAGTPAELGIEEGVEPFVSDLGVMRGGTWEPVPFGQGAWAVPTCATEGCQIRYRFSLSRAALALADPDVASAHEGVFVAPPSTWLLRPVKPSTGGRPFFLQVVTPPGVAFASGLSPASSEANTFRGDVADLPIGPYAVFGTLRKARLPIGPDLLEIAVAPGTFGAGESAVYAWIHNAVRVTTRYFGRFPVERALLVLLPTEGDGFGYGKALGHGGASILLPIGKATTRDELDTDWTLIHEILHLGFPSLPHRHVWMAEGIATYIEPIARARMGKLSAEAVWRGLVRGLPHGLPGPDDRGLDNTPTWGRTYWGGALFCLLADLELRQRSQNRVSLDQALRAVLDQGGNIAVRWDLERVLAVGDAATGLPVLRELHRKMGSQRHDVDLADLWRRLGIKLDGKSVTFDDGAPLAAVRRAITAPE